MENDSSKKNKNSSLEVDFGNRKIASQNFSKLVSIPKEALRGCGCNLEDKTLQLDVKLVQKDGERYIKLTPVCQMEESE